MIISKYIQSFIFAENCSRENEDPLKSYPNNLRIRKPRLKQHSGRWVKDERGKILLYHLYPLVPNPTEG